MSIIKQIVCNRCGLVETIREATENWMLIKSNNETFHAAGMGSKVTLPDNIHLKTKHLCPACVVKVGLHIVIDELSKLGE